MHKVLLGERKAKNMTQEEVAKLLGISKSSYARRERGNAQFDLDEAKRLSEILDIKVQDLFPEFFLC